jgi:hypothetical protein
MYSKNDAIKYNISLRKNIAQKLSASPASAVNIRLQLSKLRLNFREVFFVHGCMK